MRQTILGLRAKVMATAGALVAGMLLGMIAFWVPAANASDEYDLRLQQLAYQLEQAATPYSLEVENRMLVQSKDEGLIRAIMPTAWMDSPGHIVGPLTEEQGAQWMTGNSGPGYVWEGLMTPSVGVQTIARWLGGYLPSGTSGLEWCMDFVPLSPAGSGVSNLIEPVPLPVEVSNAAAYTVNDNLQMGQLVQRYGSRDDAAYRAAVSTLVHLNYERGEARPLLGQFVSMLESDPAGQILAEMAQVMVASVRNEPTSHSAEGRATVKQNQQDFLITEIGVRQEPGQIWVAGIEVTVTITSAGAVFAVEEISSGSVSKDGLTWTGVTGSQAITLPGRSAANGQVQVSVTFGNVSVADVEGIVRPNGTQPTLRFKESFATPTLPALPLSLVHDFQPILTSSTEAAGSRIVDSGQQTLKDRLIVSADPTYSNPVWLGRSRTFPGQAGYSPLPIKFTGIAYRTGQSPALPSKEVPEDAVAVATAEFIAAGPGEYQVSADYGGEPGFVTWVWQMSRSDQPLIDAEDLYMVASDWSDQYGIAEEHTVIRAEGKIESAVALRPTIDNIYLVDDVWISGLPEDHPTFPGGSGFERDIDVISHELYFWPRGVPAEDIAEAELVAQTTVPAANGFYASVGGLDFKLRRDESGRPVQGTYQVVHRFEGDHRVQPFISTIPDPSEQYVVSDDPQLTTTATNRDGSKELDPAKNQEIIDQVCYLGLRTGESYQLRGMLMDQSTGLPAQINGSEVTSGIDFTADAEDGCREVSYVFDASTLAGNTLVVFEDLLQDGEVIAVHHDLSDRGQTVIVRPPANPPVEPPTPEVPPQLARSGLSAATPVAIGGLTVLVGGLGVWLSRRRNDSHSRQS